jgi:4'-phosphopantetheinyl transferase
MTTVGWLIRSGADVPPGDAWLGVAERDALAGLPRARRRADWRLGRWAAKAALGSWLSVNAARVAVLAAPDGAPEAWVDGRRAAVSVSISHRGGRALVAVADAPGVVGCDLERVEPRSGAFVREWLAPAEQGLLAAHDPGARPRLANLCWTAKEAVAKVRREGLRLDLRRAVAAPAGAAAADGAWRALRVDGDGAPTAGWWRADPDWVMAIASEPAPAPPCGLDTDEERAAWRLQT